MDKAEFNAIKKQAETFTYSSMGYLDFEDLDGFHLETSNEAIVLLLGYDREAKLWHYHWAANSVDKLIPLLICQEPFLLTFVPEAWVSALELAGLKIRNKWHDYFRADLDDIEEAPEEEFNFLTADEIHEASELTLQCRGQSRGFTGQTPEWMENYLHHNETVKNPAILACRAPEGELAGILCTGTYNHESKDGAVVWVREVAVKPGYQGQGIGRKLVSQALRYGKRCGATRAFLAVDEENLGAIHLYESLGFVASEEGSEINMTQGL